MYVDLSLTGSPPHELLPLTMLLPFPDKKILSVYLRLNTGVNSMANLFSRACLAEPSMYFWVSYQQAANQAKQSARELEKNVQGLSRSLPSSQLTLTFSGNILCT